MHGRVVGLLLIALTLAPAAQAASPMPGETYEGAGPRGGQEVILVVSSTGARVQRLSFGFERGCRRNGRRLPQPAGPVSLRNVRIKKGRFSWSRTLRYPQTGGSMVTQVSGRFVEGGTRVVGTVRERMQNPVTRIRCNSGTVRWSAAVPERVLINGNWTGATAQNRPLTLTIAEQGITAMAFEVTLTCTNGEQITRALGPLVEPARVSDTDLEFRTGSSTSDTEIQVTGVARRALVTGTIVASDAITRPDGDDERTYSCSSGELAFQARRA